MSKSLIIGAAFCFSFWACNNNKEGDNQVAKPFVSKHSSYFNNGVDSLLNQYDSLSNALINWDSASVTQKAGHLYSSLENLPITQEDMLQVKKDSFAFIKVNDTWKRAKSDAMLIASSANLDAKKRSFDGLTQNLFQFLRVMQYDNNRIYLQKCPMAFNDTGTGVWISKVKEINNPYLGKHHPRYKAGMLHCGETKEELNLSGKQGENQEATHH